MKLKEYQESSLSQTRRYLEGLDIWRSKAKENPDLEIDFPAKAWEKCGIPCAYIPKKNGLAQPLPTFCLKIPTGGGKTLLAVKTLDLVNMIYRKKKTGLVMWIVPTNQIYRQTLLQLKDLDHPYRQHLDLATGGKTKIVEKTDRFTPLDIQENLVVMLLMLPSANRQTRETLKLFQDSGGFQEFFPPEDDRAGHKNLLKAIPNLDTFGREEGYWGKQIKTSLGNVLRAMNPLIILDEGHKAYSEMAQATLRGFNPIMIVELSATPSQSNVLVEITGQELLREEMIKLDLHVVNKPSPDWRDTLLAGVKKRNKLEESAIGYESKTGTYIRPICLIQVERTGSEQRGGKWIHSEQVREHLIKVMGVSPDEIAVKTSEKDELKDADDSGGLLVRECNLRYIITKQALQEGWDCSFAYVLVILTNPASKNSLTQLVGRILRQPYARKTHVGDLDESYVYCFQQKAEVLLSDIRSGLAQEGLGDLRGHITGDGGSGGDDENQVEIRKKFKKFASRTILPVFMTRVGKDWRPVNYNIDIESQINWDKVDLKPLLETTLSMHEEKDIELAISITGESKSKQLKEGGIRIDPVFMTRQICDIIPNPWKAHEFSEKILNKFLSTKGNKEKNEELIANNFVFIIEELRNLLGQEKNRLAEEIFNSKLKKEEFKFLLIGNNFNWSFPKSIHVVPTDTTLTKENGSQLEFSLYEFMPKEEYNETEKAVAWYLENQNKLFFWFRNHSRKDYSIQGWMKDRIYPDFIFTSADKAKSSDYEKVFVVETKGLHLKDNAKTTYVRKLFDLCTDQAKSRDWNEIAPEMKDKVLKFEVIAEDEWEAKINEMLEEGA